MIAALGDIHFRDDKPYFKAVSEEVLKWYSSWELNNEDNYLILLGDLVENALLTGTVADYLEKFSIYSKFKEVHVCVGNHDIRKANDENQLAYEFLRNKPNFIIHDSLEIVDVGGCRTLFLPYYKGLNFYGRTMTDYYSNLYKERAYKTHFDLAVGHFNDETISFGNESDCVRNLDKLDCDKLILGHIHTRSINSSTYIGSVFACKKTENDERRCAMVKDENGWREVYLPKFNEFLPVIYPNKLPKSNALIPIYTVLNCASESMALSKYGRIFIRKTSVETSEIVRKRTLGFEKDFENIKNMNYPAMLDSFFKAPENTYDPEVVFESKALIEKYTAEKSGKAQAV